MKCPNCQSENLQDSAFCRKCGTQLPLSKDVQFSKTMTLDTVQKIMSEGSFFASRYKILGELGQGGMGIVYKAEDTKLKRTVALKFLPAELSRIPEARERFVREAQSAAALSHPNICTIHEVEEVDGQPFITMEFVSGESLRQKVAKGPMAADVVVDIGVQVAEGLEAAQQKGIIHRDIKSANIMVTEKAQAKIMDFGLAKVIGQEQLTREAVTIGTVAYMSPEQAQGEDLDQRTDLWSFGVVLYEMLTGQLPFRGDRESIILNAIVKAEPKPMRQLKPDIPIELQKIIERALRKNREERYSSAAEMALDLKKYQESIKAEAAGFFNISSLIRRLRNPLVAIPAALALIAIGAVAFRFFNRQAKIRWANDIALPEIERLLKTSDTKAPFNLALQAEKYIPKSQKLAQLRPLVIGSRSFETEPAGADVYMKDYAEKGDNWEYLGLSPIVNHKAYQGYKCWKIIKEGFEPAEGAFYVYPSYPEELKIKLDEKGSIPSGMVRIRGANFAPSMIGILHLNSVLLGDYLLDKFEVTNKQYKEFVDNGGYQKPEYWKHEFIKDGRKLSWQEAMKEFMDRTERPGPATWEFGDYPQGRENYPVSGVSWYEAAAYAEYAGKSLPTIYHWAYASGDYFVDSGFLIPSSNIAGGGLAPVGSFQSLGPFGTYDMAGNVKEWCWNENEGKRFILGGAWNEAQYMFGSMDAYLPFHRSENFGFRCMKSFPGKGPEPESLVSLEVIAPPDFKTMEPCSDEVFEVFRRLYSYTKADLKPKLESTQEWSEYTTVEKVSFTDADQEDRVLAYLFLPRKYKPPFQTVIGVPGAGAVAVKSIFEYVDNREVELFTKNGRAFVFPVFKGFFGERQGKPIEKETVQILRDILVGQHRDMARCLDYLETRPELDKVKFAYHGLSYGAWTGPMFVALESRFKVAIFLSGAIFPPRYLPERYFPEGDMINFAPRVTIPVLIQDGKYDFKFPLETSIKPFYRLLGTPQKDKHLLIYETGHSVWLHNEYRKDMFDFLDQYLGPVK